MLLLFSSVLFSVSNQTSGAEVLKYNSAITKENEIKQFEDFFSVLFCC